MNNPVAREHPPNEFRERRTLHVIVLDPMQELSYWVHEMLASMGIQTTFAGMPSKAEYFFSSTISSRGVSPT